MFLLTCDKKLTKSQLSPTHASTKRKITDELKHNAKHVCVNAPGNYMCHCLPGYYTNDDGKTCNGNLNGYWYRPFVYGILPAVNVGVVLAAASHQTCIKSGNSRVQVQVQVHDTKVRVRVRRR